MKPQWSDDDVHQHMDAVLNQMRECILASHEQEGRSATATLLFSCAEALGPFVDPGISERGREAMETLFVKQIREFDESVADETRDRTVSGVMNECSRERIAAFFGKQMNGFNEEVAAQDRDGIITELHEHYLAGFDRCCFAEDQDASYVEPGTDYSNVVNLDRLMRDFLTAIDEVKSRFQQESALSQVRLCLDTVSPPGCAGKE